jgi:hypothetical protein
VKKLDAFVQAGKIVSEQMKKVEHIWDEAMKNIEEVAKVQLDKVEQKNSTNKISDIAQRAGLLVDTVRGLAWEFADEEKLKKFADEVLNSMPNTNNDELLKRISILEEENKKLKIDSICYTWLYEHGARYYDAVPSRSASYTQSRGPYIEMQLPSLTQLTYYPDKVTGTKIILQAINDTIEKNNRNFATCKKCNVNRLESANCVYPHACGFVGIAYTENHVKGLMDEK